METSIKTDKRNRSLMDYGTPSFPFAWFYDDLEEYRSGVIDWHWHEEIEFVIVQKNSILCCVGEDRISLSEGEGMFINQNVLHRFESRAGGRMVSLVFAPGFIAAPSTEIYLEYVRPLLNSGLHFCRLTRQIQWQAEILSRVNQIIWFLSEEDELRNINLYIGILELWRNLFQNTDVTQNKEKGNEFIRSQNRVQCMIDFIEKNYSGNITSDEIAAAANISKSEARRCFRRLIHTSPGKYLNEYRLSRAAKLLCTTDMPVSCIADACGFAGAAYFDRLFRRQYQMTPLKMRQLYFVDFSKPVPRRNLPLP